MNTSKEILITKRDGRKETLNLDKIHFVVEEACEDLSGVSASQIQIINMRRQGCCFMDYTNRFMELTITYH